MNPSVKSRSSLDTILQALDQHCRAEFSAENESAELGKAKRRMAKAAVQAMRDSVRAKLKKEIVVQEEVANSEKEVEAVDKEAQAKVASLMRRAETLQLQLQQARKLGMEVFEQAVKEEMRKQVEVKPNAVLTDLKKMDTNLNAESMPTVADINRIERTIDSCKKKVETMAETLPACVDTICDLLKVVEDMAEAKPPSLLHQVLAEGDENICIRANGADADAEQPQKKRQKMVPGRQLTSQF